MGQQGLLDNVMWHGLSGPLARFSAGTDRARRFARGFSPIVAFARADRPDFAALEPFCDAGEHFYCGGWAGPVPPGWQVDAEAMAVQMLCTAGAPADDPDLPAVRLGERDVPQMLDLVGLTRPGPFGPRNIELGEYFGCFEGERLVAMAGERLFAGTLREVSAVCTHPDFQGRGLARRLTRLLMRRQTQRGETAFLHVMSDNAGALALYRQLGFRETRAMLVRVLSRSG